LWSIKQRLDDSWWVSGHAGADYTDNETAALVDAWAHWLGLVRQQPPACAGTTEYRGRVDGLAVEVWGVTDPDAFRPGHSRGA